MLYIYTIYYTVYYKLFCNYIYMFVRNIKSQHEVGRPAPDHFIRIAFNLIKYTWNFY